MRKSTKAQSDKKYEIPNLIRAFALLEYIAKYPKGVSFPQMLEDMDCSKTTLFRILISLKNSGFVTVSNEGSLYFLSRKIWSLAYASLGEANICAESSDLMRNLRDTTGETVMLGVLLGQECIMIEQEIGNGEFNFIGKLGMKSPLHASAPGKALLAFMPDDELDRILPKLNLKKITQNTIIDPELLKKELALIKKNGFATDMGEVVEGLKCVAAPIFDNKSIIAVIWVTGPATRLTDIKSIISATAKAAKEISLRLGFKE